MWKAALGLFLVFASQSAFARDIQCNKAQTTCVAETTNLGIGDRVGVFNEDGELVATGQVSGMRGSKRSVAIEERNGAISKGDHVALLENPMIDGRLHPTYKTYREPSKMEIGAALGYSTITLGDSVPGMEATAYAQWRKWGNFALIGRVVYETGSGHIGNVAGSRNVSMQGLGLLGGLGYEWLATSPLSVRAEAAAGLMQVAATANGDKSAIDDNIVDAHVKNGASLYGRWTLGAIYHVSPLWQLHLDFAESLVYEAFANTISLGVSRDLR